MVRRGAELASGRSTFTDAELWVSPESWRDCADLIDQAASLLHEAARPPRTPETIRVAMSTALFPMSGSTSAPAETRA